MLRPPLRVARSEAKTRAIDLLRLVRIPSPEKRWSEYPHQLSGGVRQRVMIAMAVSCDPDLVVGEQPATPPLSRDPQHPYTRGLLGSPPSLDGRGRRGRLIAIPGTVPSLGVSLHGCAFAPRCPLAIDVCRREDPPLDTKRPGHLARCWVVGSS